MPAAHRMGQCMAHRGPDDEGYLGLPAEGDRIKHYAGDQTALDTAGPLARVFTPIRKAYTQAQRLVFVQRRLTILDLSFRGHQPMTGPGDLDDPRAPYFIVHNGEIYNLDQLRKELENHGHQFRSTTDTEVILRSYIQWGSQCVERFNGMFAFAVCDRRNNEIFLARDRIGIKPLYYAHQDKRLIFASDIKTILSSQIIPPAVDPEGLWHNLSLFVTPRPPTLFKNIQALPQAHWMKIPLNGSNIQKHRYWSIPTNVQDQRMTEAQAVEQLEAALTKSVKMRLHADVSVGTFMSGGIDSTTISAIAAEIHPGIKAFTLDFGASVPEYDETQQAVQTARMHTMDHIIKTVDPVEIIPDIHRMVLGYEEPMYTLAPNYLISKLISRHPITVVLNGLGGDELFAGYSPYRTVRSWPWKKIIAKFLPSAMRWSRYRHLKTPGSYHVDQYSIFSENDKRKLFLEDHGYNTLTQLDKLYPPPENGFTDHIEALSYFDIMNYIGNHHVYRIDQFTMMFSLEGRFPFLDHELVELAFRIPSRYKINNQRPPLQKYVLRKVAEKYIAPSCLTMKKKGFGLPVGRWMRKELKNLTESTLKQLKARDIFNNSEIDRLYQEFSQGSPLLYKKVWHLVMLELWYQQFIDKQVAPGSSK